MANPLETLMRLVPPPTKPRCPKGDWSAIERQIGFKLPLDYKQFIESYGTGSLQSFMHIWNYLDVPSGHDVLESINQITSEYEYDKQKGYPLDYIPFPKPGCMIPFCSTDDGNYLNWRTGVNPSNWCVVAYDFGTGRLLPAEGVNMVQCLLMLIQRKNPFGDAFCNVESFKPPVSYNPR